jgi:F0F1-type ATP synthase alpha subunit
MKDRKSDLMSKLEEAKELTDEIESGLKEAIEEFKKGYRPG